MRKILGILLILICQVSLADEVRCYSESGKLIYKANVLDIEYNDDFLSFVEYKSGKIIFVNSDCVVKFDPK